MSTVEERMAKQAKADSGRRGRKRTAGPHVQRARGLLTTGGIRNVMFEEFEPAEVRPWRYANRVSSALEEEPMEALAQSIARDSQLDAGLARRLPVGEAHKVECIFGRRRLDACRRVGKRWVARVVEEDYSDADCAKLMYAENAHAAGVGPLEEAGQWARMLADGVFAHQKELCARLGVSPPRVSRMLKAAEILKCDWLAALATPVLGEISVAEALRIGEALADPDLAAAGEKAAAGLEPGKVPAGRLYASLFAGETRRGGRRNEVVLARKAGRGRVPVRVEAAAEGGFTVRVGAGEQTVEEQVAVFEAIRETWARGRGDGCRELFRRRLAATAEIGGASLGAEALGACVWMAAREAGVAMDAEAAERAAQLLKGDGQWEKLVDVVAAGPDGGRKEVGGG